MHKLIGYVCDELEEIERKVDKGGKISGSELQYADTLAHLKKNLLKAEEMSGGEYSSRGYSRRMSYGPDESYSYAEQQDYVRPDGSYRDGGMSYARGRGAGARRDSMGRYSRSGEGVDPHTKDELMKLIENM